MGKLSEEGSKVMPHPVCERIEMGGPIDEHDDDVHRGAGDDVVRIMGVGGERHRAEEQALSRRRAT